MKKTFLVIILCLSFTYSMSQEKSTGQITYGKRSLVDIKSLPENIPFEVVQRLENMNKTLSNLNYILRFNKSESDFFLEKSIEHDLNKESALASKIGGGRGLYYNNLKDKEAIHQIDAYGSFFLIKDDIKRNWVMSKETKIINGYLCLKAKTSIPIKSSRGDENRDVTAWYCPELPINHGPIGFGGLPGLILELDYGKFSFYVKKMKFNQKIKIKKPSKGKSISRNEFDELSERMFKSMKEQKK